jgi:ribosomal protein S12 methylthiotransferase
MRDNDRIVKYIDMPLQHISDRILKKMNRRGDSELIKNTIAKLRREIPDISIRTTFIVGFPGETDEDFNQTREFLASLSLLSMHVFAYSRRPGTLAATMEDQVSPEKKSERMRSLEALRDEMTAKVLDGYIGRELEIIVEEYKGGKTAFGHTSNFIEAGIENAPASLCGHFARLLAERHENGVIYGKIL